eukprot:TRINITY_DN9341_c0_g1_i1.p1 TRINITY_DN9341_c0_g1~~TRINITY_DN9341_c0_g1_i1.p1  ORF type:complete len:218 (+),score=39.51 TRINITY_DN9341_c0_g1_i1:66-719(+)
MAPFDDDDDFIPFPRTGPPIITGLGGFESHPAPSPPPQALDLLHGSEHSLEGSLTEMEPPTYCEDTTARTAARTRERERHMARPRTGPYVPYAQYVKPPSKKGRLPSHSPARVGGASSARRERQAGVSPRAPVRRTGCLEPPKVRQWGGGWNYSNKTGNVDGLFGYTPSLAPGPNSGCGHQHQLRSADPSGEHGKGVWRYDNKWRNGYFHYETTLNK